MSSTPNELADQIAKGRLLLEEATQFAAPLAWDVSPMSDYAGKPKSYKVRFGSNIPGRFKCTCPDFTIRRVEDGIGMSKCKHIVMSELILKAAHQGDEGALARLGRSAYVYYLEEEGS